MKLTQFILPITALGICASLFLSGSQNANAFVTNGDFLPLGQRDFRIFNNFTDSASNNNTTPDDQFPGYQGAVMALWKACVEWGSIAHGDGSGDSTQTALGSGGANFDPSFQGEATTVGGSDSNTISEINASDPMTLAFAEGPYTNGWRIRFLANWNWADGPAGINNSSFDIQGVGAHEYGHCLGLGHSANNGATMSAGSPPGSTSDRSISNDDRAGLQSIYGVMDPNKPTITGYQIGGGQITITGTNYSATGNQVWFTQAAAGGSGLPVKVLNVDSPSGTSITVAIPASAGPGDILVRGDTNDFSSLSNAFPTDLEDTNGCVDPVNYCAFLPNSVGLGAQIGFTGTASISANNLSLTCQGAPSSVFGIFFYGDNQLANFFGEGLLCAGGNIKRLGVQTTDVLGTITRNLDLTASPFNSGTGQAISGQTKNFQFWYRDVAGGPSGFNTSDGLAVTWCD